MRNKSILPKRVVTFLLSFICFVCSLSMPINLQAAIDTKKDESIYSYYLFENFEYSGSQYPFSSNLVNTGLSYISGDSKVRAVDWNVISDSHSVEIQSCDIRWWSLSAYENEIYVGFEFMSVTENFANTLEYCVTTQDSTTGTEGNGGLIVKITPNSSGQPVIKNRENKEIVTLENKKAYNIVVVLKRASDEYTIMVDGTMYERNKYASAVYGITGQRVTATTRDENSTFVLDNLSIFATKKYSQSFSAQEKIDEPEYELDYEEQTATRAYYNDTQIELSAEIIEKDGTFYLPLKDFVRVIGGSVSEKDGNITITAPDFEATAKIDSKEGTSKTGTSEEKSVTFNDAPFYQGKILYAPLNMINMLFEVKVWYDKEGDMIVISNKEFATDGILRVINCRFYMNGQPYYEMSFNKFDLVYQISADYFGYNSSYPSERYTYAAAEEAIKTLAENGFKSIRFFCICGDGDVLADPEKRETYFKVTDAAFDLLDKYNIKATVDLCLISDQFVAREYVEGTGYVRKTETTTDLVAFADSESRAFMYEYLEEFIERYKDRDCILMWEIQNEGALGADLGQGGAPGYSLMQLGNFYSDVVKKIKSIDPKHLVSSGDACLRSSQYSLFLATINGEDVDWTLDTAEQRLKALSLLDYGVDVISVHTYSWGQEDTGADSIDENGESFLMDYEYLIEEARKLGKALYSGEFSGTLPKTDMSITDSDIAEYQKAYLEYVIEQGVQLGHWWTFESDRQGFGDDTTWNCSIKRHKFTFDAICEANKALQEKYVVNGAENDNIAEATSTIAVDENYSYGKMSRNNKKTVITVIIACACACICLLAVAVIFVFVKKKKH